MRKPLIIALNIAGYNILVEFHESETTSLAKDFKEQFEDATKYFLVNPFEKVDFKLIFKDNKNNRTKKNNKNTNKQLITYYQDHFFFKTLLENVLYKLCSNNKALIVHSSAVAYKNNAYLFLGKSGAGKSTIAKLLSDDFDALADDTTIIRKIDNRYLLYQHPFIEKNEGIKRSGKAYQLSGVFILKKSNDVVVKKITNEQKVLDLVIKQLTVTDNNIIKNAMELVSEFDSFNFLYFPKNKSTMIKSFRQIINENLQA